MLELPDADTEFGTRSDMAPRRRWSGPTVLEVWSPTCVDCKALRSDLHAVANGYTDRVRLELVNAIDELEMVRELGVKGTPTLIGLRDDEELFRVVGRRTRSELERLFEAVAVGDRGPAVRLSDAALRVGAGIALIAIGYLAEPAWPLMVAGVAIVSFAVISWIKK